MKNAKRYHRQTILPEIGATGQKVLSNARVLCVGAGGLGSPALLYLSAAGIGTIGIIDGDEVSLSNLHRQVLFTDSDIKKSKTRIAAEKIRNQNPDITVIEYDYFINASNAESIIHEYDLVIDGTDNFSAKYVLNDVCVKHSKPLVYASISRFEGRVAVFDSKSGACYRCLYARPPQANIQNCSEAGILGAVAGVIGTLQALEAIKTLIWINDRNTDLKPLISKMAVFDFASFTTTTVAISKNEDCLCSRDISHIKPEDLAQVCATENEIPLSELKSNSGRYILIDVRENEEWNEGHIQNAIHWPLHRFEKGIFPEQVMKTPENTVLYCSAGFRSAQALRALKESGINGVKHLGCGIDGWDRSALKSK